jgi:hypothetical protein
MFKFYFDLFSQQLGFCLQLAAIYRSDLLFGYTVGTNWELPSEKSFEFDFFKKKEEMTHRRSRRELYAKLEPLLNT